MFTVKEVSEILSVSPHALRFYDNEGLLPGLSRRNTHRFFSYEDRKGNEEKESCNQESSLIRLHIRLAFFNLSYNHCYKQGLKFRKKR
jgi:DNA-binding transcriptional MerR regulator